MKIKRNDLCPCGSGKKYKKCCLNKIEEENKQVYSKNPFQLKGKKAEEWVYELATKSFLTDWCYPNPKLQDNKELCDLLIVFDDTVIIWQIKDLKRKKNGRYNQKEVEKNLRQLNGARRMLFDLDRPIELENPRRGKELFNPELIKKVFLISALVGEGEDYFVFVKTVKDKMIHVINKNGVEIFLNELDTISDFVNYLKEKEDLLSSKVEINLMGGEEELLAYYLINEKSFAKLKEAGLIIIQEGCWEGLQKKSEYIAKNEENKISYFWDDLIEKAHLSGDLRYERIAREMAKLNRFERRIKSKAFIEAKIKANAEKLNSNYRRTFVEGGVTYCFLYSNEKDRKKRVALLSNVCFVTRGHFKENNKVLGIATEMRINYESSFDFCWLDFPTWTKKEDKIAEKIVQELGMFKNEKFTQIFEDEYPQR